MALLADVATNAAATLVLEGLKHPFQAVRMELERRDVVRRGLRDLPTIKSSRLEAHVDDAVRDLSRIIGSAEGKLTRNVVDYLDEVKRTSLLPTMAQMIMSGRDPDVLRPAFESIHQLFDHLPFTSDQFVNGLKAAITFRVEAVEDPVMLDIIRAQSHAVLSQLDQIALAISRMNEKHVLTFADMSDARMRMAKAIEAANRYVSVETLQGSKKFRLSRLAIPARLKPLDEVAIQAARVPDGDFGLSYQSFRQSFSRAVILGDPGGGKSTLTQLLCVHLSNSIILHSSPNSSTTFDGRDLKIPFRIILRGFEARKAKNAGYTIVDYLHDELRASLDGDSKLTYSVINRSLILGQAVVVFDGLDEVLDVGARREMVSLIEQFGSLYPACPILITSRLVGYRDAPLCPDFSAYALARFKREEVLKYAERGIRAVSGKKISEARELAGQFYHQTEMVGGDLRENPLMLGLMVQIYVYRGDVPSNRPEIYKECALLMFEKWDLRRQIVFNVPREDFELLDVFSFVAGRIFGNAQQEEGVSREWLISELRHHFEGWYIDKANASRAARALVDFLTGRAWVMSEVGPGIFKFTHRTFLEYFFARGLISEAKDVEALVKDKLIDHVRRNEWDVISHLALQMAVFRDGGKMKQAADALSDVLQGDLGSGLGERALLEFTARAFEYLTIPETQFASMVKEVSVRAINIGASGFPSAVVIIRQLLQSARHRRQLARDTIASVLEHALGDIGSEEALFALYTLGVPMRSTVFAAPSPSPYQLAEAPGRASGSGEFEPIKIKYRSTVWTAAQNSVLHALAYIFLYGDRTLDLYKLHGEALIQVIDTAPWPISGRDQFAATLISAIAMVQDANPALADGVLGSADIFAFAESVASDAISGRFRPAAPIDVVARHARTIGNLEIIFRRVYVLSRNRRRFASVARYVSVILVCAFLLVEMSVEGMDSHEVRSRRQRSSRKVHQIEEYIPLHAVSDLVERLGGVEYSPALAGWLRETVCFTDASRLRSI